MTTSSHTSAAPVRVFMVWCPQWALTSAQEAHGIDPADQLILTAKGLVVAASPSAQSEGVTAGTKVRAAGLRCPEATLLPHDPELESTSFHSVLRTIESAVPGVHLVRPGLAAVRAQGASRFYGNENAAALVLLDYLHSHGYPQARVAVADGLFAAEHAAYTSTPTRALVTIPAGQSAHFVGELPITALDREVTQPRMLNVLQRMGIRRLRDLAALPRRDLHARFGEPGRRAHQLASGEDAPSLTTQAAPKDWHRHVALDPPTDQVEQIVHECENLATDLVADLERSLLVCNEIRIQLRTDHGQSDERLWRHPWHFGRAEIVDRVRWQLQDLAADNTANDDEFLTRAVTFVSIAPESVDAAAHHAQGLWGERPDEHVIRTFTGLQHDLGYDAVLACATTGGRLLHERRVLRPWGDALPHTQDRRLDQPWPGSLEGPSPATVFTSAQPVLVLSESGVTVRVDDRGQLTSTPVWLCPQIPSGRGSAQRLRVTAWAGPWPVRQHWWRSGGGHGLDRFQLIDDRQQAWLLLVDGDQWWLEARYD